MENILNQRFNFLLVLFSLFVTAAVTSDSQQIMSLVLWVGCMTCGLVGYTIVRAFVKHDIALQELYKADATNPAKYLQAQARGPSARWIMGWGIPLFCFVVLLVGACSSSCGHLSPKGWGSPASAPDPGSR